MIIGNIQNMYVPVQSAVLRNKYGAVSPWASKFSAKTKLIQMLISDNPYT